MHGGVAFAAQRDQVLLGIIPGMAAKLLVVNFKIGHHAARLAPPTIPAEHFVASLVIRFAIQTQTCALWSEAVHEAFSVA